MDKVQSYEIFFLCTVVVRKGGEGYALKKEAPV